MSVTFTVTPTATAEALATAAVDPELAADLVKLGGLPRDRQANVDFATPDEVKEFIRQAKAFAVQNGYIFSRVAPDASHGIKDMPLRVSFRIYKAREAKADGTSPAES